MPVPKKIFVPQLSNNAHLTQVAEFFGTLAYEPANIAEHIKFIFLCFTNRSGSNYLAELLSSDQSLPTARENLNFDTVVTHARQKQLKSFQAYFAFLVRHTVKNGVMCLKVAPPHLELLGKSGILDQVFARSQFVLIERSDKLAQAISHLIAFQTGKFMSTMNAPAEPPIPVFNREQLDKIMSNIASEYAQFSLFFGHNGLTPAHVIYEQMLHDPVRTLSFVGPKIGFPDLEIKPEHVRLNRQAGQLNEEWRRKYLSP